LIATHPIDQSSCAEESISFVVSTTTGNYTYQWQVDEGSGFNDLTNNNGYSGATSSELLINTLRSDMNGYRYRVMVGGSCGVETSMSATLAVYDLPEVSAGEDVTIANGSTTTLEGIASGFEPLQYLWMPMEGEQASSLQPAVSPFTDTEYTLTVTSAQGCVASDAVMVFVTGERELIIPNAFSPNNDAINDTWEIQNLNPTTSISVNVFNRYGQTVFATNNYPISWDGRYNGNLLPWGTYYYVIELSNPSKTISGWVVILN
ncbi:MAG: gliding motility-associated C-terminal domain-containing protein, partial [Cyclobacteriaceae bacterium]|nr:gliding motility-associated C-terminal domain-containing protein [Cyclobacteriaceae bacterium]